MLVSLQKDFTISLGNDRASFTQVIWEPLFQCHLGTIVPVSLRTVVPALLRNNFANYLETIVTFSLANNLASVTCEQSCQCRLETIVTVSLGSNHVSLTWEKLRWPHLETIVPASLENNAVRVPLVQLCHSHLGTILEQHLGTIMTIILMVMILILISV